MMLRKLLGATLVSFACGAATACAPEDSDAGGETIPADVTAIDNTITANGVETEGRFRINGAAEHIGALHMFRAQVRLCAAPVGVEREHEFVTQHLFQGAEPAFARHHQHILLVWR